MTQHYDVCFLGLVTIFTKVPPLDFLLRCLSLFWYKNLIMIEFDEILFNVFYGKQPTYYILLLLGSKMLMECIKTAYKLLVDKSNISLPLPSQPLHKTNSDTICSMVRVG